jgi:enoyl-CoA hydratase/carnithine racemase
MDNQLVILDVQDDVGIVKLNHGVTNAINLELVNALSDSLQRAKAEFRLRGLVFTSTNDKFFSIGFNLPEFVEFPEEALRTFYTSFNQMCLDLFTFPKPTIAAISGHAIAGGCILALCCDYRFIAQGRKLMGLNEIKLGLPVPYVADCILRHLVGLRHAREIMDSGEFYPPEDSLKLGLVDAVMPLDEVLPGAIEKVKGIGSYPEIAFATIKANRVEPIEKEIRANLEERERMLLSAFFSTPSLELIKKATETF